MFFETISGLIYLHCITGRLFETEFSLALYWIIVNLPDAKLGDKLGILIIVSDKVNNGRAGSRLRENVWVGHRVPRIGEKEKRGKD